MFKPILVVLALAVCAVSVASSRHPADDMFIMANSILTYGTSSKELDDNIEVAEDFLDQYQDDPTIKQGVRILKNFVKLGSIEEQILSEEGPRCEVDDIQVLYDMQEALIDNSDESPYSRRGLSYRINQIFNDLSLEYATTCFIKFESELKTLLKDVPKRQQSHLMTVGLAFMGFAYHKHEPVDALKFAIEGRHIDIWEQHVPKGARFGYVHNFEKHVKFVQDTCAAFENNKKFVDLAERTVKLGASVDLDNDYVLNRESRTTDDFLLLTSSYEVCNDLKGVPLEDVIENASQAIEYDTMMYMI